MCGIMLKSRRFLCLKLCKDLKTPIKSQKINLGTTRHPKGFTLHSGFSKGKTGKAAWPR